MKITIVSSLFPENYSQLPGYFLCEYLLNFRENRVVIADFLIVILE